MSGGVGRERELAELEAVLALPSVGRGELVLIAGEAGIGKTRLAEMAAERARAAGLRIAWAGCWEAGAVLAREAGRAGRTGRGCSVLPDSFQAQVIVQDASAALGPDEVEMARVCVPTLLVLVTPAARRGHGNG